MATLWHGRFTEGPAEALRALNDSLPFDQRMFREDNFLQLTLQDNML